MSRHLVAVALLGAVAACASGDQTRPELGPPSFAIVDGTRSGGNPDFFFLPPMVNDPSGNPNFQAADFNPSLIPLVKVCAYASSVTTEAAVTGGAVPDCHYTVTLSAPLNLTNQFYNANWTIPNSNDIFYRVSVVIGLKTLGYADVESVPNPSKLKTVDKTKFVGQQDGSNLPVKFRIEIGALCDPPGTRPCNSSTINFANGGSVNFSTDGGNTTSGVNIPGGNGNPHTLTLQKCPSFNDPAHPELAVVDFPVFGSCVRVTSADALTTLNNPAIVQICDLAGTASGAGIASEAQEHRITLHRKDGSVIKALPHAVGCAVFTGQATPSVGSVLADLAHGRFKSAGGKLLSILSPTPLYARRIDEGGGGQTGDFSDFQFGLPSKATIDAGDGQAGPVGSVLPVQPRVKVTDLGGEPVKGATIKFQGDGVAATSLTTDATGLLSIPWTLPNWGLNSLTASGRGIGGDDISGPRCGVDPFQAIQGPPHPAEFGPAAVCGPSESNGPAETPVTIATGSVVFNAYGAEGFETSTGDAWTPTGFWHKSGVGPSIINQAYSDGLVTLAPDDASGGAMPNPWHGTKVFWYGTEPGASPAVGTENGNYIGPRSGNNTTNSQSGGESTAPNNGTLTSPSFVVPAGAQLSFRTWWEIESAEPNAFDKMTISVLPSGGSLTPLGQLNPTSDPDGNPVTPPNLPYTSSGNNLAPAWVQVSKDLSAYAGQTVQLVFNFDTGDINFNGFRGWLLDNILVAPSGVSFFRAALLSAGTTLNPPTAPGQPRRP